MNKPRTVIQQRHKDILNKLQENQVVYVTDLCHQFQVTDMTIRRDLLQLEKQGLLQRFHGGARPAQVSAVPEDSVVTEAPSPGISIVPFVSRNIANNAYKKDLIAKEAAKLIEPGEVVFMNSGTTGIYILKYITGKNVRIVSNNAAMALIDRAADTELTIAGGEHFARTQSFVGPLAKSIFMNVIASKCFLSVSGISSQNGITSSCFQETEINNLMIERCCGKRIVVADGSKIGRAYSFISCKVTDVDILITDKSADPVELENLRSCGLQIIVVDEAAESA